MHDKDCGDNSDKHHAHQSLSNIDYDGYDSAYYVFYFIGRFLVVIISYFLCIIASLYATGSLVTLEATNFFCPSYTLEEVRQYNLENGNENGVDEYVDSCLRIDRQGLNYNVLSDSNYNIFIGKIDSDSLDFMAYFQAISYFATALILSIPTLYHTYLLIYDTINAIYSVVYGEQINDRIESTLHKLHAKTQQSHQAEESQDPQNICMRCCKFLWKSYFFCVRACMKCYFKHIQPIYYVDSKWRMLSIMAKEWFEILIQIYALLLYGGINVFDSKLNVLSQSPDIIESFAVIISVNCLAGMFATHMHAIFCFSYCVGLYVLTLFFCCCSDCFIQLLSWFVIDLICCVEQVSSWQSISFLKFCD